MNTLDWKLPQLSNPAANEQFTNAWVNEIQKDKAAFQEKFGDNAIYHMKQDPTIAAKYAKMGTIAKSFDALNETFKDIMILNTKDKGENGSPYRSPELQKMGSDYLAYADQLFKGQNMEEAANKLSELGSKIITYPNVIKTIDEHNAKLNDAESVNTFIQNMPNMSSSEERVSAINTLNSPFVKPKYDDKNQVIGLEFDIEGAKKHSLQFYEQVNAPLQKDDKGNYILDEKGYPKVEDAWKSVAPDPKIWTDLSIDGMQKAYKTTFDKVNLAGLGWAKEGREKKKEERVRRVYQTEGRINIGNTVMTDPYNFEANNTAIPIKVAVEAKVDASGNPIEDGQINNGFIVASGVDDKGQEVVAITGDSFVITNPSTGEGVAKKVTVIKPAEDYQNSLNQIHLVGRNDQYYQEDKSNVGFSVPKDGDKKTSVSKETKKTKTTTTPKKKISGF